MPGGVPEQSVSQAAPASAAQRGGNKEQLSAAHWSHVCLHWLVLSHRDREKKGIPSPPPESTLQNKIFDLLFQAVELN